MYVCAELHEDGRSGGGGEAARPRGEGDAALPAGGARGRQSF